VNQLIRTHSAEAFVVFTGLPHPPHEENMAQQFIQDITVLSGNNSLSAIDVASVRNSGMSVGRCRVSSRPRGS